MPEFRRRPLVIEAVRFEGLHQKEKIDTFVGKQLLTARSVCVVIPTLEGDMIAEPGDWIIQGVAGEFYPCKPLIFEQTYEAVE